MTWSEYWDAISPKVAYVISLHLTGSCGGVDAQDILQDVALDAWLRWADGNVYTAAYWKQCAVWKTINTLRKNRKMVCVAEVPEQEVNDPCTIGYVEEVTGYLGAEVTMLMLSGHTITECASELNVSKATMSRKWNAARMEAMAINMTISRRGELSYVVRLNGTAVADVELDAQDARRLTISTRRDCNLGVLQDPTTRVNLMSAIKAKMIKDGIWH